MYAARLEKKLVEDFKQKFQEKLGYIPVVLTKITTEGFYIPTMTLDELVDYFDPFLPYEFGKKLAIASKSRKRELVEVRMMFCYLARSMKYNLGTIGQKIGGRDHTTVIHGINTFINLIETSESFREKFQQILNHIKENHESSTLDKSNKAQCKSELTLFS
jgi:hypothetical protein